MAQSACPIELTTFCVIGQELVEKMALPETESLWYMAQSPCHRRLLKHPVITSFLWMKWQRIRNLQMRTFIDKQNQDGKFFCYGLIAQSNLKGFLNTIIYNNLI
jgi:hypothetical protein